MTIVLNGRSVEVEPGRTVGQLVDGLGRGRSGIAVAVGDDIVPRVEWDVRRLADGDRVEVLTAAQGG